MATSSDTSDQNVKSRRPAESAFKQQRLPAWQPILTAGTVLPTFFVIGIAFIPVGIGLLYFSDEVKEKVIDYTMCMKKDANISCADYIKQSDMDECLCEMDFTLTEDFKGDVYFYYGLSNYYQNHRRYVKSRDDSQLLGFLSPIPSGDCAPFAFLDSKPVAPCGAIANSLFNDTLNVYSEDLNQDVPVNRTGIAWDSDKRIKFRNPTGDLQKKFENFSKPLNWRLNVWELDLTDPDNNGFQNEDLIVWMRTAALPTFRKLYRRVDHTKTGFTKGLVKGPYTLRINYNYPVTDFDGTKTFIISTTSLLGGKNPFLGIAYVVVGTLCLLLGIVLLVIHVRCSKRYHPTPTQSFFLDVEPLQDQKNEWPTPRPRPLTLPQEASELQEDPAPQQNTDLEQDFVIQQDTKLQQGSVTRQVSKMKQGSVTLLGTEMQQGTVNRLGSKQQNSLYWQSSKIKQGSANLQGTEMQQGTVNRQGSRLQQSSVNWQGSKIKQGCTILQGTQMQQSMVNRQASKLQQGTVNQRGSKLQQGTVNQQGPKLQQGTANRPSTELKQCSATRLCSKLQQGTVKRHGTEVQKGTANRQNTELGQKSLNRQGTERLQESSAIRTTTEMINVNPRTPYS